MNSVNAIEFAARPSIVRDRVECHRSWIEEQLRVPLAETVFMEVDTPIRQAATSLLFACRIQRDSDTNTLDAFLDIMEGVAIPTGNSPFVVLNQSRLDSELENGIDGVGISRLDMDWQDCPLAFTLSAIASRVVSLKIEYQTSPDATIATDVHLLIVRRESAVPLANLLGELNRKDRQSKLHMPNSASRVIAHCDWNQLVLDSNVVMLLKNDFDSFFQRKAWFKAMRLPFRRGYLLHGPPGNGKTTAVRAMLTSHGLSAHTIRLFDSRTDDSDVDHLFTRAAARCPSVVLLEDIDRAFPKTGQTKSKLSLQHLLNALDGVATGEGIIVIATANEPTALDPAILRRPGRTQGPETMRRWILLLVIGCLPPSAMARRVTVAQCEHAVAAANAAHKSDAELGRLINGMDLSERLTNASLERIASSLHASSQSAAALHLLADRSAFLVAPAGELPSAPAPDEAAQGRMLESARTYVAHTLPNLPNLLATRTIHRYDDSPAPAKPGDWPSRSGLHLVDTSSREITIRSEQDLQSTTKGSALWKQQVGLISGGEFGSTLAMVLTDAGQNSLTWSHWEETATGRAAVFHYEVPRSSSHFELIGSEQRQAAVEGVASSTGGSRGTRSMIAQQATAAPWQSSLTRSRPGYSGALWIDPETGVVLRITMEANPKESAPFRRAAMLVEYGTVEIGSSQFICPLRSLALSAAVADAQSMTGDAPTEWLNEIQFTNYHRFASTVRVVPATGSPQ